METQQIWNTYSDELYFFILKKVRNKNNANDIFQNTFLKIHKNLFQLKNDAKVKAWVFQIARNEIVNYMNQEMVYVENVKPEKETSPQKQQQMCCFDTFINDLPKIYRDVVELVYIKGKKQKEVAITLEISLENVKARLKRAKEILKKNFNECCKYQLDKHGKLIGESDCSKCSI